MNEKRAVNAKIKNLFLKISGYLSLFWKWVSEHISIIAVVAVALVGLTVRYLLATYPTRDVTAFIFDWMSQIQKNGFKSFYATTSDYSTFFGFILALISLLPKGPEVTVNGLSYFLWDMYYLKTLYFICDILISFGVYLIVAKISESKDTGLFASCICFALPGEILISSMWGNADPMYIVCIIFAVYFAISDQGGWASVFLGLGFAVKLQIVFVIPFFFYLILKRKLNIFNVFIAIASFLFTCLPAWFCGASFSQPFNFFEKELSGQSNMYYGSANLWRLFPFNSSLNDIVSRGALWEGLLILGIFLCVIIRLNISTDKRNSIAVAVFLTGLVPYVLPHMHERYFYILDVMVVIYAFTMKKRWYLIPLMQLSCFIVCSNYISGHYFIEAWGEDSVCIASVINAVVLSLIFKDIISLPRETKPEQSITDTKQ